MIKAVILDFDGVLVDSEPLHMRAEKQVLLRHGIELTDEIFATTLGWSSEDCFAFYVSEFGLDNSPAALIDEKNSIYSGYIATDLRLMPHTATLLDYITRSCLPFCIASSGTESLIRAALRAFRIEQLFGQRIVSMDTVKKGKPAPDLFLAAASLLAIEPSDCVVIEDSIPGITAAESAGMMSVLLGAPSPECNPHAVCEDLEQVVEWIATFRGSPEPPARRSLGT